jgi:HK97 family phage prohead protease
MQTIPTTDRAPIAPPEKAVAMLPTRSTILPRQSAIRAPETKDAGTRCERRAYGLTVRATGDDGSVEGYGSVFGMKDSYDDVIQPGAFSASLAAHRAAGTMPAMLWQHDQSEPIGVWSEMVEDERGLRVKGRLVLESERGRAAHALLKAGALNGLSIGFMAKEWSYDRESEVRTLTGIDLWEVSMVTFPAQRAARVTSVKSADVAGIATIRQAEKALRDAGFSSDAAGAYVAQVKRIVLAERDARDAAARATDAANRLLRSLSP